MTYDTNEVAAALAMIEDKFEDVILDQCQCNPETGEVTGFKAARMAFLREMMDLLEAEEN